MSCFRNIRPCTQKNLVGNWLNIDDVPFRNNVRVSLCDATHCNRARALQTRFDAAAVN